MHSPSGRQWMIATAVALAAGAAALYVTRPTAQPTGITAPGGSDPLQQGEIASILEPDAIEAVDRPTFVRAGNAGVHDNARVIGVTLAGEAHAFPIAYMSRVEIVNDRLGGGNIAITW